MEEESENKEEELKKSELIKKSEKISIKEGSFAGVMDGFGTKYVTPYALALGASNIIIALIDTLPGLLGNLNQLHSLRLLKKKSRKHIVTISVFFQSILWIPLIGVGVWYYLYRTNHLISILLLVFYSFIVIAGSTAGPAWNSWMKDLITVNSGRYFGKRNRMVNLVSMTSMFIAAGILSFFSEDRVLVGFFIIFFIAFLGRGVSFYLLRKQYEPVFVYDPNAYFSLKKFTKNIFSNNFGRFVVFISLVSFATAISGPFFAVYMLKNLNFSYIQYTLITICPVLSIIIFMPFWGGFADKFGNIKVIKITSIFIPLIPLLWALTIFLDFLSPLKVVAYLVSVELFSGFVWAGFNLCASNFIYDAVTKQKMAFCVTYFNIINSSGALLGAVLGGLFSSLNASLFGLDSIIILFIASGFLRIIIVAFVGGLVKEVRIVPEFKIKQKLKEKLEQSYIVLWRYLGFEPIRIDN